MDLTEDTLVFAAGLLGLIAVTIFLFHRMESRVNRLSKTIGSVWKENSDLMTANANQINVTADRALSSYLSVASAQLQRIDQFRASLDNTANSYNQTLVSLQTTVSQFSEALDTIQDFEALRKWGATLNDAVQPINNVAVSVKAIEETNKRILEDMSVLHGKWSEQEAIMSQTYGNVVGELSEWQAQQSAFMKEGSHDLMNRLEHLTGTSETIRKTMGQLQEILEKEAKLREELMVALPNASQTLNNLATNLQDLQRQLNELLATLANVATPLNQATENLKAQMERIMASLVKQTEEQAKHQQAVNAAIWQSNSFIAQSTDKLLAGFEGFEKKLMGALPPAWMRYAQLAFTAIMAVTLIGLLLR